MAQARIGGYIGLNSNTLKIIAIICMLIDHVGAFIMPSLMSALGVEYYVSLAGVTEAMRFIGRFAFPLFCFLLVEGFKHTKNIKRYIIMMALFALISEIPFDLVTKGVVLETSGQNVFFTLTLGLLCLLSLEKIRLPLLQVGVVALFCILAYIMKTDYSAAGIIIISLFWVFGKKTNKNYVLLAILILPAFFLLSVLAFLSAGYKLFELQIEYVVEQFLVFAPAVFAVIPIMMYNGKRGKKIPKYIFYWFYPVHLLALYFISNAIY